MLCALVGTASASKLILSTGSKPSEIHMGDCKISVTQGDTGLPSIESSCDLIVNGASFAQLASDVNMLKRHLGLVPPPSQPPSPPPPSLPPPPTPPYYPPPPHIPASNFWRETFSFAGDVQTYVVPGNIGNRIRVKLWGAAGGSGGTRAYGPYHGGSGAFVTATCTVSPGETLYVVTGEGGFKSGAGTDNAFGGGGRGGPNSDSSYTGAGGGGLSGIFTSDNWDQGSALVVAGGGGGASAAWGGDGGGGGHPNGLDGTTYDVPGGEPPQSRGFGGTQTAGGAGGTGGRVGEDGEAGSAMSGGDAQGSGSSAGAGGAGWYGGGGGDGHYSGGGGGSSWADSTRCSSIVHINGELGSGIVTAPSVTNGGPEIPAHPAASVHGYETGVAVTSRSARGGNGLVILESLVVPVYDEAKAAQFAMTGSVQQYTVPQKVEYLQLVVWGAAGGSGGTRAYGPYHGGSGAFVTATCTVSPGETLYVVTGEGGFKSGAGTDNAFGGGGRGGPNSDSSYTGAGGGGLSGIFTSDNWDQGSALVVAGGGGGASAAWGGDGGGGGHPNGLDGTTYDVPGGEPPQSRGFGGTQTAGGAGGTGGRVGEDGEAGSAMSGGDAQGSGSSAGAGGAGWYGGGGGDGHYSGGGGGSSWADSTRCSSIVHINGELGSGIVTAPSKTNSQPPIADHPAAAQGYASYYTSGIGVTSRSARGGDGLVVLIY